MPASKQSTEALLAELIRHPTVSRDGTADLAAYIADYLADVADVMHILPTEQAGHVNLLARIGPQRSDRRGLLLSGHLDVVPVDEPEWDSSPFQPRVEGDAMYGRGTCDMKAAVAVFMNAMHAAQEVNLNAPLWLLLSCDEEVGSLGVQHFVMQQASDFMLPDCAIIGEPTSLQAVRMHKGHLKLRATFAGQSAHTGTPHLGRNAIDACADAIGRLRALNQTWQDTQSEYADCFASAPHPALSVVGIRGGNAWNVVPDQCEINIGVRVLPGMESDAIVDQVRSACIGNPNSAAVAGACRLEVVQDNPPLLTEDDATVHRAICQRVQQSESIGVSFASDGGMLKRDLGIDCVLFGPGDMSVAHKANEHISLAEVQRYEAIVHRLVRQFCLAGEGLDER